MNITCRTDKNILYIAMEGRLEASNASAAEERIFAIRTEHVGKSIVIDADKLEYISSAGLRIILKLRKKEPDLAIINVSPEVYDIFDMTGFTDMITIEKTYKRLSLEGCEFIARGANGAVYRYDDETILKLYDSKDALFEIRQERESARKAFVLGVSTAIPYGIVRVDDGYATVTELLNAVNLTKLLCDDPVNLEKPVEYFVDLLKSIHEVEARDGDFPDMRETALEWASFVSDYIPKAYGSKLCAMVEAIPKSNTLLHGDYHTGNVMIQEGEPLLIDLDTLCVGHPIFEFGSMYNAFLGFSERDPNIILRFMGYDHDTALKFWNMSLKKYLGTENAALCEQLENKARVIGYMRLLRRSVRRTDEEDWQENAAYYKEKLMEMIEKVDTLEF